jgi:hypothetical protein
MSIAFSAVRMRRVAGPRAYRTRNDKQPYARGCRLQTPFGFMLGPNITPDPDAGIGKWTADEISTSNIAWGVISQAAAGFPGHFRRWWKTARSWRTIRVTYSRSFCWEYLRQTGVYRCRHLAHR